MVQFMFNRFMVSQLTTKFLRYFLFSLLFLAAFAQAENQQLKLLALFKDAAMVEYAGKQKVYRAGENLSKNIKLLSANSKKAIFLINGKKQEFKVGMVRQYNSDANLNNKPTITEESQPTSTQKTARILRDNNGMFFTPGFINGRPVRLLVDTGATLIAMSEKAAQSLNISYRDAPKGVTSTANGNVMVWSITLKKVKVGDIELRNIAAVVLKGEGSREILLGNSFLGRLRMENDGMIMTLTKKY